MDKVKQKLIKLREYAKENHIPVLKEEAADILKEWLTKSKPQKILEIGASIGTSGILALSQTNAKLTTIEKDEDTFLEAKKNFEELNFSDRTELILGDCFEVLMLMTGEFNFVILDGPKGHNKELVKLIFPLLKNDGIIFVDNINFHNKVHKQGHIPHKHRTIVRNMRDFISYINSNKHIKTTIYNEGDGIAVIQKQSKI